MRRALVYPFTKLLNYQIFPTVAGRFVFECCKSGAAVDPKFAVAQVCPL